MEKQFKLYYIIFYVNEDIAIMKTILLETNAINRCLKCSLSGKQLKIILDKKALTPVVNIHTTYELARTFLTNNQDVGKILFLILKELNPIFSCLTGELIIREINKLRQHSSVDNLCTPFFKNKIDEAVDNLSDGNFIFDYKKFIQEREKGIKEDEKIWNKKLVELKNAGHRSLSYKELVAKYITSKNLPQLKKHIHEHIGEILSDSELMCFITQIKSYPAIHTLIKSDLYLNYLVIANGNKLGKDKIDDLRHLIDASYCTSFATNDDQLTSIAQEINPEIEIITFEKLIAS